MSKHGAMVDALASASTKPMVADAVPAGSVKCPRCRVTVEISKLNMKDRCHSGCPLNADQTSDSP